MNDTSPEAERVLIEVYRKMPVGRKWLNLGKMFLDARALHAAGVRLRNPQATEREIADSWIKNLLGPLQPDHLGERLMETPLSSLQEFRAVARVFLALGIPYALGGSMASSVHGRDRYTRDADVTVEPFTGKEQQLIDALGPDYYLSLPAIQDAIRRRASFNIINSITGFKTDVFVRKDTAFEQAAFQRRADLTLPDNAEPITVHSAEDIILFKLRWYRLGNETSEQQWKDIRGVVQTQGDKLDQAYLDRWAPDLGVADLLQRVREESAD